MRSLLRLEPADIAGASARAQRVIRRLSHLALTFPTHPVVLSATSADAFTAAGFLCVVLGTPLNSLLPAGPPLQQVTVSDVPLLLARRLGAVVAGYTLTAKRERSLLASTLLPPLPRHGLCAAPVALPAHGDPPQLLAHALRRCDVIMHKATDQLAMPVGHALDIARACHIHSPCTPCTRPQLTAVASPGVQRMCWRCWHVRRVKACLFLTLQPCWPMCSTEQPWPLCWRACRPAWAVRPPGRRPQQSCSR